jgi:uncharacterized protein (TIGR02246 family)
MTDDERAIRDVVGRSMSASGAGDLATVSSLMADDVVSLVSGQKPFGEDLFAAASEAMKDMPIAGASEIEEIEVVGDWAYSRNFLTVAVMLPSGSVCPLEARRGPARIVRDDRLPWVWEKNSRVGAAAGGAWLG